MSESLEAEYLNAEVEPESAAPLGAASNTKASAIAKKRLRNRLVIFGGALLVVGLVSYNAFMRTRNVSASIPQEIQGVGAMPLPGEMVEGQTALASSPAYSKIVTDVNNERLTEAEKTGRSGLPLADTLKPEAPAAPAPAQQYEPNSAAFNTTAPVDAAAMQRREQQLTEQARVVQQFIKDRRDAWAPKGIEIIGFGDRSTVASSAGSVSAVQAAANTNAAALLGAAPSTAATAGATALTLIPAGTMVTAVTLNRVNTDIIAPVVATIATGQYAGAKIIGTPSRAGELAKIEFTTISIPSAGVSLPIQAFSLDAQTLDAGVATDVDRKLFSKYLLRPAAAAIAAVGEAAKTSGGTVINMNGSTTVTSGVLDGKRSGQIMRGALAEQVSKDLTADSTDPTVHIASKTLIGVIFAADVVYTPK